MSLGENYINNLFNVIYNFQCSSPSRIKSPTNISRLRISAKVSEADYLNLYCFTRPGSNIGEVFLTVLKPKLKAGNLSLELVLSLFVEVIQN